VNAIIPAIAPHNVAGVNLHGDYATNRGTSEQPQIHRVMTSARLKSELRAPSIPWITVNWLLEMLRVNILDSRWRAWDAVSNWDMIADTQC